MSFDYAICAGAAALVLVYLVVAMLRPEKF
jgi:K+-transporting ATPase KdpF subunit